MGAGFLSGPLGLEPVKATSGPALDRVLIGSARLGIPDRHGGRVEVNGVFEPGKELTNVGDVHGRLSTLGSGLWTSGSGP